MSSLILPRRFTSQPQGAVELDRDHWIVQRGITLYAPLFNQQGITRSDTKIISGLVLVPDVGGVVGSYNGSTSQTVAVTPPSTSYTMMFWGYPTATGTNTGVALNDPSANLAVRLISGGNPSSGTLQSNGYSVNTTTQVALNQWRHICGVVGGATDHRVYINGGSKGSDTTSDTRAQSNITIGGYDMWGTRGNFYNGRLAHVMVLPWAMTDDEVLRAYQEQLDKPWQLFRAKPRVLYFDASTGSSFPSLSSITASSFTTSGARLTVN